MTAIFQHFHQPLSRRTFIAQVAALGLGVHGLSERQGSLGIAWRTDKLKIPPTSWKIFHDQRLRGRMAVLPISRGGRAGATACEVMRSVDAKAALIAGEIWVAQLREVDAALAQREQPHVAWLEPA